MASEGTGFVSEQFRRAPRETLTAFGGTHLSTQRRTGTGGTPGGCVELGASPLPRRRKMAAVSAEQTQLPQFAGGNAHATEMYHSFTTPDGYRAPSGIFHPPDLLAVPGTTRATRTLQMFLAPCSSR